MVKVKICGITNVEDALCCVESGADALGFVFYEKSARYIDQARALAIISKMPALVQIVGLFVNQESEYINRIADYCKLDLVQLHGDESPKYCEAINRRVIKAFRVSTVDTLLRLKDYSVAGYLLDAYQTDAYGGTGKSFNWDLALFDNKSRPIILAGGLDPDNVGKAISQVVPFGVDVSTGVESTPGRKDHQKIANFIRNAKFTV